MNARPELFEPVRLGDLELPNRLVMAPLTRSRSTPDGLQTPMHATYYAQRAGRRADRGARAAQIGPEGQGYAWTSTASGCTPPTATCSTSFLRSSVSRRTDRYGASVENRIRLVAEVVDALCGVWAPGRIGVRLTPSGGPGGSRDDDPGTLYVEGGAGAVGQGARVPARRPPEHARRRGPAGRALGRAADEDARRVRRAARGERRVRRGRGGALGARGPGGTSSRSANRSSRTRTCRSGSPRAGRATCPIRRRSTVGEREATSTTRASRRRPTGGPPRAVL